MRRLKKLLKRKKLEDDIGKTMATEHHKQTKQAQEEVMRKYLKAKQPTIEKKYDDPAINELAEITNRQIIKEREKLKEAQKSEAQRQDETQRLAREIVDRALKPSSANPDYAGHTHSTHSVVQNRALENERRKRAKAKQYETFN